MNIRSYIKSDWNDLCKVHDLARADELKSASLEGAFLPLEVAAERENLFGYEVLVAECGNKVHGFIAFDNEEIAWLYVNPQMYRKGVGKALVEKALALSNTSFSIEVLEGNSSALNFYKHCGFKEIGIDSGSMPGNENFTVTVHLLTNAVSA